MSLPEETARELAELSGVPLRQGDLRSALSEICRIAVRALPSADGASLTSFNEGGPGVVGASDEWTVPLDEMQYEQHEGPCLDASRTGLVFRVRDATSEPRWPNYMPLAVDHGVRSSVSVPLHVEGRVMGALNLYSRELDAFSAEDVSLGEIIAGHASLATQVAAAMIRNRDLASQLSEALQSRATIEQAKGIVMATAGCGPDAAFELLVQQSQHENRKLREVCADLVRRYG